MMITDEPVLAAPEIPYRGIQPFRYADHTIFFARETETWLLTSLVDVYRGVFLYGDSGSGKSSLVNAGLLPQARRLGFEPILVRVQPRAGKELVIEQIGVSDDSAEVLPSLLATDNEGSSNVVLSISEFEQRVHAASNEHQPLIVFDQFEEILTLFDKEEAVGSQRALAEMIVRLLRESVPVKLLFAFREDYLGRVKQLLDARPELVDQALRLVPPSADALETIIRGPFERFPGHFARELEPPLAERLRAALAERFGTAEVSLSEVQTVCLRLWQSSDPEAMLAHKGLQGLLEDDLGEALDAFSPEVGAAAIALLSHMVTAAGTRDVVSAEDLRRRVREEDDDIPPTLLDEALDRLECESKLVRRERRHDLCLYEITSEFLVPWIRRRREELRLARERRRLRILGSIASGLLILAALVTALAIWALHQRAETQHQRFETQRQASDATSLALTLSASALLNSRPDVSLLLALEANRASPRAEARSSALAALTKVRDPRLLAILHGDTGAVQSVAFSSDGRTLATASFDGTIRLWDVRTHKQLGKPLTGHANPVFHVAFSRDGRTLASASFDRTIRLWDVRTHKQLGLLRTDHRHGGVIGLSRDGRTMASASADKTIRLFDVRTHEQVGKPLRGHTGVVSRVVFSSDGRRLATASLFDKTIRLWDLRSQKQLGAPLIGHSGFVGGLALSPGGRTLAFDSSDRPGARPTIRLWDVRRHKQLGAPLTGHDRVGTFSRDGRTLASVSADNTIRLWDVRTHNQLGASLTGHSGSVGDLEFNRDGRTLASAYGNGTVRLWDLRPRKQADKPLRGHTDFVSSVAFSPDGRALASASADKTLRLWDVRTHKQLGAPLRGHTKTVLDVGFSPNRHTLASASADKTVRLWDVRTHKQLGAPLSGHTGVVIDAAFSPDGSTLASASFDKTVRLWDVRTRKQVGAPLSGHTDYVNGVAFGPDGRTLASGSSDKTLRLWDVRTHKQLGGPLTDHTSDVSHVAFSPDGRTLASASTRETIQLWDVRSRKQLSTPLRGHTDIVTSVAFSIDGRTLASASQDNTIRLWDVRTHKPLGGAVAGHTSAVFSAEFSPDERTLASSSDDNTIRLWEKILWHDFNELQTEVCGLVGSGLSTTEWARYANGIPYRQSCP